ncbi:MAG: BON domain-containing protein [Gammaproteobacteria bacterium]|nr:BON domain-containing protein [Gammaproteobacteria bacterium]
MKKIFITLGVITFCYNLSACSPILVVGATAGAGATIATDRRSAGKIVEDQAIEMQASDYIYSHEVFGKKVHVAVTSVNGVVLLTGEVPEEEYKHIIYDKINRMRPVREVINKIQVREKLSLDDRSNDVWVTSKIKTRILAKKGLLSRTKVVTSNNNVYLMGMVNKEEANEIITIVKEIDGIENVIPLYEAYKDELPQSLTASAHKSGNDSAVTEKGKEKIIEKELEEEDAITMQPYVIQPPITLSNDE